MFLHRFFYFFFTEGPLGAVAEMFIYISATVFSAVQASALNLPWSQAYIYIYNEQSGVAIRERQHELEPKPAAELTESNENNYESTKSRYTRAPKVPGLAAARQSPKRIETPHTHVWSTRSGAASGGRAAGFVTLLLLHSCVALSIRAITFVTDFG